MNIGIDARKIRDFGIGMYIENLLKYLPEFDTENEYIIFHYPEDKAIIPHASANFKLVSDTSPKYSIRELISLPVKMWQHHLDLFHAPHYTLPPFRPCKGIVTIHDVIHLRFPEYLPHPAAYYYAKGMMWAAAKSAKKIITVSECSKRDIVRYLGIPEEKIEVIYNGIDLNIETSDSKEAIEVLRERIRSRFGISRPYLLYLGNFLPHKNLDTFIKAYALLKRQYEIPHCLVLAGKNDNMREKLQAIIDQEQLTNDVFLTGFVEDEWKSPFYACADLFVYPSLYEGFGLQALEAMAHHTPVAISNVAALPEIAGDAAVRFDPNSPENMAATLYNALTDQPLRATLIQHGTQRLQDFSWQEMAKKTVEVYKDVLGLGEMKESSFGNVPPVSEESKKPSPIPESESQAMKVNEYIEKKREQAGLSIPELAEQVGISPENLWDIEAYKDEIYDVVDLKVIRAIADALNVPLLEMLGIEEEYVPSSTHYRRHEVLRTKRLEKGLSQEELGDIIGFYPVAIVKIEEEEDALDESLPYSAIITLSETLDIPLPLLLGV